MPRISASSIHEQRSWRRNQLISAAASIALEDGVENLTVASVAERAGLSRTSVYEYFASKEELVQDLIVDELQRYVEVLSSAITGESNPERQLIQWIETALHFVADGRHLLIKSLNAAQISLDNGAEIATAHRRLLSPLRQTLNELGVMDADQALSLIRSATDSATKRIESGADSHSEIDATTKFVIAGLRALKNS